jgi:hypothetical protein
MAGAARSADPYRQSKYTTFAFGVVEDPIVYTFTENMCGSMTRGLDSHAHTSLRHQVLQRDRWRCQWCGSLAGLEVQHWVHRNQGGVDSSENLIALCTTCQNWAHRLGVEENACRPRGRRYLQGGPPDSKKIGQRRNLEICSVSP